MTRSHEDPAARYDRLFGPISRRFVPTLLWVAEIVPGEQVLDIATGTGLAADMAAVAVGPTGHVVAADVSPAMLEGARRRLAGRSNVTLSGEDGQSLTRADLEFDLVICHFGLAFFANPEKGLSEFHRVLRPKGRVVVSVGAPHQMDLLTTHHQPGSAAGTGSSEFIVRHMGDKASLKQLLKRAGFVDVRVVGKKLSVPGVPTAVVGPNVTSIVRDVEHYARRESAQYQQDARGASGSSDVEVWFATGHK